MKAYVYSIIAIVAITVIGGFFLVGSPKTERMRRLDDQRVANLQYIQSEVLNYWINKGTLPTSLSELRDDLRGIVIPQDPETGAPYAYAVNGPTSFSLCATFAKPNTNTATDINGRIKPIPMAVPPGAYYDGLSQNWQHDAGYACFDRTIDKDFYQPRPLKQA